MDGAVILDGIITGLVVIAVAWLLKSSVRGLIDDRIHSLKTAVGTPNGNGNLAQMTERLLGYQVEQMKWQEKHDEKDELRFTKIYSRLDKLEGQGRDAE